MKIDLSQFRQTFLTEAAEHLSSMETNLLQLRTYPDDVEILNSIFRSAHSIKGGAGSFGLSSLVRFTHVLETLLDRLREFEASATEQVIELLLHSVDALRSLLDSDPDTPMPEHAHELQQRLEEIIARPSDSKPTSDESRDTEAIKDNLMKMYRVEFCPDPELFASGTNPILLLRNLASMGTVSCCHLHAHELPALDELDPARCYLSWTIELASTQNEADIREVFEFVEHLADVRIHSLGGDEPSVSGSDTPSTPEHANDASAVCGTADRALRRGEMPGRKPLNGESTSIRVATEKVDRLIDLVGELVIAQVMTAQMVENFDPSCLSKLKEAVSTMGRNTRELHERVMAVRMLPMGTLFQRFPRTVYDIAQATGKQIRLATHGEDTEIDKSMLEMLSDPLTHLIRNAADHGIGAPEARLAQGKSAEGVITLRAFHRAGRVVVEVSDDGAGIDTEKIRAKAVERGMIAADAQMTPDQIRMLIFEPGFSTREEVSDFSGRGVGMDVVRRNVHKLNGTLSVSSEQGKGSRFTIELPLTLAILEGLLVRVVDRTMVLPLLSVIETVPLREADVVRVAEKGEVVVIRNEPVPLLRVARFLGVLHGERELANDGEEMMSRRLAVIVQANSKKLGLVVDELLGQQQVVLKSLEQHLRKVDGLMGATILGDGCVAPILDVGGLSELNLYSLK